MADRLYSLWLGAAAAAAAALTIVAGGAYAGEPCRIEVVEARSGVPVPLVELRTVSNICFVSDNAGLIAMDLPECMGREIWFHVSGQGYEVAVDGFGMRGVRLTPRPGGQLRVEVQRKVIARRVGRLTGSGLFAESQELGLASPLPESGVVGCDSVQVAEHRGRLFWLWGDTSLDHYPLGVFHASAATTTSRPIESAVAPLAVSFNYFRDGEGRPRGVAPLPGEGPTWLVGLVSLPDGEGTSRLVASYLKVEAPLTVWQKGLCVWNDSREQFERQQVIWNRGDDEEQPIPDGHAIAWRDDDGQQCVLFGNPFPSVRTPATFEGWSDPTTWRTLSPPKTLADANDSSRQVQPHSGSLAWSDHRNRWVAVFVEAWGKPSFLGEVWYAEANSPLGPWTTAVKILSHERYSFYNPRIHVGLTAQDSPLLLFEGTYTTLFAGAGQEEGLTEGLTPNHPRPTPRYDYNQILYSLDLDDPRLQTAQTSP